MVDNFFGKKQQLCMRNDLPILLSTLSAIDARACAKILADCIHVASGIIQNFTAGKLAKLCELLCAITSPKVLKMHFLC
ncbi:unnamed protein product [Camellia sinensis]